MSKKELKVAKKIKLPKFMMSLAEFESNCTGRNSDSQLNKICFKIINPSLIESESDCRDDETKSTSLRDSYPEVLQNDISGRNFLDDCMNFENGDQIESTPYFSSTKSIYDIRKFETQEFIDESPFKLSTEDNLETNECYSHDSSKLNLIEDIRISLDEENNMKLFSKAKTSAKMNEYKQKILNTINCNYKIEFDQETCESTPHKVRVSRFPNSALVKHQNRNELTVHQFECAFTEIEEDNDENSRNSLRLSVPMRAKRSFMLTSDLPKHFIRESCNLNFTYEDMYDLNREIESKFTQISQLKKLLCEQEQINCSLHEEVLKIAMQALAE